HERRGPPASVGITTSAPSPKALDAHTPHAYARPRRPVRPTCGRCSRHGRTSPITIGSPARSVERRFPGAGGEHDRVHRARRRVGFGWGRGAWFAVEPGLDRKSTRLNYSHVLT